MLRGTGLRLLLALICCSMTLPLVAAAGGEPADTEPGQGEEPDGDGLGDPVPPGSDAPNFYSTLPVFYTEIDWGYLLDARLAAQHSAWACGALTDLGPGSPTPAERCFIGVAPGTHACSPSVEVDEIDIANRYVFNSATPALVERPSGESYIAFYVQSNNWTGLNHRGVFPCPWDLESGPGSWLGGGGDEFVVFSSPATLEGARGQGLTLEEDVLRPDDGWFWQFKSAVWESDRGPDGRMALFAKRTDEGEIHGDDIQINHLMFLRSDDPLHVNVNAWETMFWNCQAPCTDATCTAEEQEECGIDDVVETGYRLTDLALVDEVTTADWDYVGVLTWFKQPKSDEDGVWGITPIRIKSRVHVEIRDTLDQWVRIPWGGKLTFAPQRELNGRAATIARTVDELGVARHELWRIRTDERGGASPCEFHSGGDETTYVESLSHYGMVRGRFPDFFLWDASPDNLTFDPDSRATLDSTSGREWHLPGDYNASYIWVLGRLQLDIEGQAHQFLYMGTRDPLICTAEMLIGAMSGEAWEKGTGKGVAVSEIVVSCPLGAVFCDGFESGGTTKWSLTTE
jgi:hypothetical protein